MKIEFKEIDLNTIESIASFGSDSSLVQFKDNSSLYITESIDSFDYIIDNLTKEGFGVANQYPLEEYEEDMYDLGEWIITIK
jgi:hypothetical protein